MLRPSSRLGRAVLWSCLWFQGCGWPERSFPEADPGEETAGDDVVPWTPISLDGGVEGPGSEGEAGSESGPGPAPTGTAAGGAGPEPTGAGGTGTDVDAPMLNQSGNPLYQQLVTYANWLSTTGTPEERLAADQELADNLLTWQMPHGGFFKYDVSVYQEPWNESAPRSDWTGEDGIELGTIDNNATVTELLFLADVYKRSGEPAYRDGASLALEFLLGMQLPSGGFPQVYPEREGTTYSNHVTFNDDAMVRVLVLLLRVANDGSPVDGDIFSDEQRSRSQAAIDAAVEFILAAQIEQDGLKTVWCAQHDAVTHEPRGARSYELPSKSGNESVGVVTFLMTQPQTPEVEAAVKAAIAWYESEAVQMPETAYVSRPSDSTDDSYNPIRSQPGSTMWCRFYELDEDVCFYSGRLSTDDPPGNGKQYDIMDIEPERRYGYQWGGSYGTPLIVYARSVGY